MGKFWKLKTHSRSQKVTNWIEPNTSEMKFAAFKKNDKKRIKADIYFKVTPQTSYGRQENRVWGVCLCFYSNIAPHHVQCFYWHAQDNSETNHKKFIIKLSCFSLWLPSKRIRFRLSKQRRGYSLHTNIYLRKMLTKSAATFYIFALRKGQKISLRKCYSYQSNSYHITPSYSPSYKPHQFEVRL